MHNNPLIAPILSLLQSAPAGLSEHEIITRLLQQGGHFTETTHKGSLALFQKHFLVMNALYQLQETMGELGMSLQIDPLLIRFVPKGDDDNPTDGEISVDEPLRRYYLDWNNLLETSESDVAQLLQGFWERYYAIDKQAEALSLFGLADSAEVTWEQIQRSYRQLITLHHPDKGGEHSRFIELREAYELLKQLHAPPGRSTR